MTEQPPPSASVHRPSGATDQGPWAPRPPEPPRRHSSMPYPGTNHLAATAVSFALLGIVPPLVLPMLEYGWLLALPIVGMVFGIVALVQLRRYPQRGRGMAITGVLLGAGVLAVMVLGGVALLAGPTESSVLAAKTSSRKAAESSPLPTKTAYREPAEALEPGVCFDGIDQMHLTGVRPRACTERHEAQLLKKATLPQGDYPGPERVEEMVRDICGEQVMALLDERFVEELEMFAIYPDSADYWYSDRKVTCMVAALDRELETSVLK